MTVSTTSHSKLKTALKRIFSFCFWICVWQGAYRIVNKDLLVASPKQVGLCLLSLVKTGDFWLITGRSLLKISEGYLLGISAGTVLAVLTASIPFLYDLFYPAISTVRATPVASFIIFALIWMKRNNISMFICFLMVLPIIWANVSQGIKGTDKNLLIMAKTYSFGKMKTLTRIYIPSVMPSFITGATTALGFAWKSGIAAEVLSTPKGYIGTQLYNSKVYLETEELFAWTIVVVILSFILEKAVVKLLKALVKGEKE